MPGNENKETKKKMDKPQNPKTPKPHGVIINEIEWLKKDNSGQMC